MHVMAAHVAGPWIGRNVGCGKHILPLQRPCIERSATVYEGALRHALPAPFAWRVGVFAFEGLREPHLAEAVAQVLLMDGTNRLQVRAQRFDGALGQHRDPVFRAFAIANDNLAISEIEVLHAKAQAIH